jgi:hypothetical protein
MSLYVCSNKTCVICKKKIGTVELENLPKTMRCQGCREVLESCIDCISKPCPNCSGVLINKKDSFPDNIFAEITKGELSIESLMGYINKENVNVDEILNEQGGSVLMEAAIKQNLEICQYLIDQLGADVSKASQNGRTALIEMVHTRSLKWNKKIVTLLRGSINFQDNSGNTALMFAATGAGMFGSNRGNIKIVKHLIELGADLSLTDNSGFTALGRAMESNNRSAKSINKDIVTYLQAEMIKQEAMRLFKQFYRYDITDKGELKVVNPPELNIFIDSVKPSSVC